jgi:hypothetical protein
MLKNIRKRLEKLEQLEESFTVEEIGLALRHHAATGDWPDHVSAKALELAAALQAGAAGIIASVIGDNL